MDNGLLEIVSLWHIVPREGLRSRLLHLVVWGLSLVMVLNSRTLNGLILLAKATVAWKKEGKD